MKLPEWRPIPPHMRGNGEDSQDALVALWLVGAVVLIVFAALLFLVGLLT